MSNSNSTERAILIKLAEGKKFKLSQIHPWYIYMDNAGVIRASDTNAIYPLGQAREWQEVVEPMRYENDEYVRLTTETGYAVFLPPAFGGKRVKIVVEEILD